MALLSDKINGVKTIIGLQSPAKAGFLQSYGGVTAPSGWLACDGSAVSRTTYSQLFANIGTKYGVGDGSTTFNLPSGPSSTVEVDDVDLNVTGDTSTIVDYVSVRCEADSDSNYRIIGNITVRPGSTRVSDGYTIQINSVTFTALRLFQYMMILLPQEMVSSGFKDLQLAVAQT